MAIKRSKHSHDNAAYQCWVLMKQRCNNPNYTSYSYYGGRGIRVCKRWENCFDHFIEDVGARPSASHSLDRINTDGDYEPGNVRWATRREQSINRRNYGVVPYKGVTLVHNGTFRAKVDRKHIGCFKTAVEAARAYDEVARVVFGDFAHLNFGGTK